MPAKKDDTPKDAMDPKAKPPVKPDERPSMLDDVKARLDPKDDDAAEKPKAAKPKGSDRPKDDDDLALRPDAIAEAEHPGVAAGVPVADDASPDHEPQTVAEIDALLRNPDFDPEGMERQRLAEKSQALSRAGHVQPAGVYDAAVRRGDEPGVTK